jgi:S-formylglutathione hydrolase FrmB
VLSRRTLLGGAVGLVGAAAVAAAVPDVRHEVRDLLGLEPESPHPLPSGDVGVLEQDAFESDAMRRSIGVGIAYPAGVVRGLPVLLELHGRGADHREAFRGHHLGAYLSDAVRQGVPPFVVVAPDGGDHSWWHPRADGTNPLRMLVGELLPRLAARGLLVDRFAVGGWSMGGYGSILLAEVLGPSRVAALVPDSPAIYERWQDSSDGAFDSRADFDRHDVLTHVSRLKGIPTRVTCGTSDPLYPAVREFLRRDPTAERELGPGGHNRAWWQHAAPGQLAFAGHALALR